MLTMQVTDFALLIAVMRDLYKIIADKLIYKIPSA